MLRFLRSSTAALLALSLFAAAPLFAQTSSTTGAVFGVVSGTDGAPLPGVSVTLSGPALQGTRTATTSATGEYVFPLLPPGDNYRVQSELSGFERQLRETVVVSLNRQTRVNFTMSLTRVSENVTVSGGDVVIDPTETNTQVNLKEDFLKYASVGQVSRAYQSAIEVVPGVADQTGAGGNPSVFGANLGQNSYQVDGLNTTDPVTHTFSLNFGFDAIQEIAIQTGGFEAEYGRAVGGIINVITKSGGNRFSGTADARYTSDKLTEQGSRLRDVPAGQTPTRLANDKNLRDYRTLNPEASIGGPIIRDRVWFFGDALRNMNRNQPLGAGNFQPGVDARYGWNLFGKITGTPVSNQTATFRYTNSYQDQRNSPNTVASQAFISPEAAAFQYQKSEIYNASYDAVFNSKWIANLQGGITNSYLITEPQSGDLTTTGTIDQATGIVSGNFTNFQKSNRDRSQVLGSTTYYFDALGTHAVKGGADFDWTTFKSINNTTGTPFDPTFCSQRFGQPAGATCGAVNQPNNGANFLYVVSTDLPQQAFKGRGMAFYMQDEWRPVPNVTVKIGARYDQASYSDNEGTKVKVFDRVQPRFGFAWDIFNNASTIVRGQAGQFMEDLGLNVPSYLSTTGAVSSFFGFSRSRNQFVFLGAAGGPTGNEIDSNLKTTYTNEASVGITRRVLVNTSVDLSYVYREGRNIIEDSCLDQAACPGVFFLTNAPNGNPDLLRSDYHAAILTVQSRLSNRSSLLASYTYSKSRGSLEYTQNGGADFDVFPEHFVNRYGYLSDDARHRIKLDGYYRFPFDIVFGTHVYWDSGVPYDVTTSGTNAGYGVEFLEPRGSRRLPHFHQWDAQLQKEFPIGPVRFSVIGSVFNILNSEIAVSRNGSVGTTDLSSPDNRQFNVNNAYQRPRHYEVGLRLEF
ncbi:MAG: TonB-dependent receptor [Acidobacteriota bacterium]|nr:TonB-dependent receptor [Acidobacteriota bacterium]